MLVFMVAVITITAPAKQARTKTRAVEVRMLGSIVLYEFQCTQKIPWNGEGAFAAGK